MSASKGGGNLGICQTTFESLNICKDRCRIVNPYAETEKAPLLETVLIFGINILHVSFSAFFF
jgi:hypothetical protein